MKEVLLSDWTLAAVKQREEDRLRKAQAEPTPVALKPREENQRGEAILLSDWTLAAVKQREEDRRRHEREERQRAKETFVSDSLITFNQKEEERREKQTEEKQRAEEPPLIDPILVMKQKEEERRKEELAAEVAVVTVKQAEIAEARIVPLEANARRAKGGPREREKAEPIFRVVENTLQRERQETRAVPKRVVVRSLSTARIIRRIVSTLTTVAIAGAIGFGAGVYATPPDKADEFRALVNSKLEEINGLIQREWAAIEPRARAPSQSAAPTAPEPAPKEIQSAVPAEPAAEAPAADAAGQKDMPDANAIAPSATPTEKSDSQSAPAPSAELVVPVMSTTPPKAANFEQAPHPKAPVKKPKPKPKPKPAEHHPKAEPAEQAPAAEEPAQQ